MSLARRLVSRIVLTLFVLSAALGVGCPARADGGHIAFHATQGSCTVTLFTAPEPLVTGRGELSLLVQAAETDQPLPDATAEGTLQQAGSAAVAVHFSRSSAANPLLLLAAPAFPAAGPYTLVLSIRQGGAACAAQAMTVTLAVAEDHGRRTTLLVGLGLPLVAVLLFLVNQGAKDRARSRA